MVPPFLRPGEAGVVAHFAALAAASPVPLVVYHIPYRTGQHLSADAIRRLADLAGVVGIKYAVGGIDSRHHRTSGGPAGRTSRCSVATTPSSRPMLALGAHGGILASAHVATACFVELVDAWHAGATRPSPCGRSPPRRACRAALFAEPNPTVIKAVLHAQGRIPTAAVRLPLLPAGSDTVQSALRRVVAAGEGAAQIG